MKLKIKDIDISSGGPLIAVMNKSDAALLDLHLMDRIKVKKEKKIETVVLDISEGNKIIPEGRIGVFEEVINSLKLKNNDEVTIIPARKPLSLDFIKKKLEGERKRKKKKKKNTMCWVIMTKKIEGFFFFFFWRPPPRRVFFL